MKKREMILSALASVPASELTYAEWLAVGMALHAEGFALDVWDAWSRSDSRYKEGECEKKWASFGSCSSPVTGGTLIHIASEHGWSSMTTDIFDWDDTIYNTIDNTDVVSTDDNWDPVEELKTYLRILFSPDDIVGFVTTDVYQDDKGKWRPIKGNYSKTAGELLKSLDKYPNDISYTIGDCKPGAGAWIRFNPLDGNGVKNVNVTRYTYALVESDTLPIAEQDNLFRKLELPIAVLVHSGGKSLHAIIRVDAADYDEYRKRVGFLYDFLEKNGVTIDRQNRNPSRLSRMPGVMRDGKRQYIIATNIGKKDWNEWVSYVDNMGNAIRANETEANPDIFPEMEPLSLYQDNIPSLPEELIAGVLRKGHKMLISGCAKAGKSCLLMELSVCVAEGLEWLGFQCKQGVVLYINLEIDRASCVNRFFELYKAKKIEPKNIKNIVIWNLRGFAVPLDKLVPVLVNKIKKMHISFDAIIIDPIYKIITGDENNATEMGRFCNQLDNICAQTGAATIYCHHHSKGAQGGKKAIDRASGSGVFARDPDAQLDLIELEPDEGESFGDATAWRLESSLREFANIKPVNIWFSYPLHIVDNVGELNNSFPAGNPRRTTAEIKKNLSSSRKKSIDTAYEVCKINEITTVHDIAQYLGVSDRCVRDRIKELPEYQNDRGIVTKIDNEN